MTKKAKGKKSTATPMLSDTRKLRTSLKFAGTYAKKLQRKYKTRSEAHSAVKKTFCMAWNVKGFNGKAKRGSRELSAHNALGYVLKLAFQPKKPKVQGKRQFNAKNFAKGFMSGHTKAQARKAARALLALAK